MSSRRKTSTAPVAEEYTYVGRGRDGTRGGGVSSTKFTFRSLDDTGLKTLRRNRKRWLESAHCSRLPTSTIRRQAVQAADKVKAAFLGTEAKKTGPGQFDDGGVLYHIGTGGGQRSTRITSLAKSVSRGRRWAGATPGTLLPHRQDMEVTASGYAQPARPLESGLSWISGQGVGSFLTTTAYATTTRLVRAGTRCAIGSCRQRSRT